MEPGSDKARAIYPTNVSDAEWEFCQAYLVLMKEDAPQRQYPLRELLNELRNWGKHFRDEIVGK